MLVQKTGNDSVVILLDREDNDSEEYLFLCARRALEYEEKICLEKPEISAYSSGGRKLVFVRIPSEGNEIFSFASTEDMIDAVRVLYSNSADCELYGDGQKVYIKTKDRRCANILREYGDIMRDSATELRKLGGSGELRRLCGG